MATWDMTIRTALANAINTQFNSGGGTSLVQFRNAASAALCTCTLSATAFASAISGTITNNAIGVGTATASDTINHAIAFNRGGTTVGVFVCSTAGTVDFVFGALGIASSDTVTINSWTVLVSAS